MDYKKYLENINSVDDINDDFDLGLLSGLEQKAPRELHENVMKLVRQENNQVKYFNYKKYMPVAAAILVGILTFANSIINDNRMNQNLPNKTSNLSAKKTAESPEKTSDKNQPNIQVADESANSKKTGSNTNKDQSDSSEKTIDDKSKQQLAVNDNVEKPQEKKSGKDIKQDNKKEYVAVNDKQKTNNAQQNAAQNDNQAKTDTSTGEINNDAGNLKEEQEIKYGIAFDSQRQNLIAKSYTQDTAVNYEVELSIENFDIIDFINSRGSILSYRIYRLSREDASMLDALLSSQQIQKKVLSEASESDSVVVKLIIGNK